MKINIETAKKLYPESPEWFKKELITEFGIVNLRDWRSIKTFEEACEFLEIEVPQFDASLTGDEIAYKKLKIIVRAVNERWVPDWNDKSEQKWWPWFVLSSGFGFVASYYNYAITFASSGSRLCFQSKEKSDYTATQFLQLYKQFLTI